MRWTQEQLADYQAKRRGVTAPLRSAKQIIRQSRKQPNETEKRFELDYLRPWQASGQIDRYGEHESIRLKIANGMTYTPDWPTWKDGRLQFWEIKGAKLWDDAVAKLKISARVYPEITFYICQWKRGTWTIHQIQT